MKFLNFGICREQDEKCFLAESQHVKRITSEILCSGYSIQIRLNLTLVISLTQLKLERFVQGHPSMTVLVFNFQTGGENSCQVKLFHLVLCK